MDRYSVRGLVGLIQDRQFSVRELLEQYLGRIQTQDGHYRVMATISEESVRILSDKSDRELATGNPVGALHGIPILIDDLIDVANMRTTYGSDAFADHVPEVDALSVRRLRAAGAIVLGKTRTAPFAIAAAESAEDYVSRSPLGEGLVSGGGSSGVSVAQALNFAPAGLGLDVGGNVMLPAAFSGVFAFRPSQGRIAHTPAFSNGLLFPAVSVVASNVADCALLLNVLCAPSEVDPVSVDHAQQDFVAALERPIRSLRVAHCNSLWNASYDDDSQSAVADAVNELHAAGCRVVRSRPPVADLREAWKTVFAAELYANHGERYREQPDLFAGPASEWMELGAGVSATDYIRAYRSILGLRRLMANFFAEHDILILSAAGCTPFGYGETPSNMSADSDLELNGQAYASATMIGALSGCPSAVLPKFVNDQGLPVSLLVVSKPGNDDLVLSIGKQLMMAQSID